MGDRKAQTLALFGASLNPDGTLRAVSPSQVESFLGCGLKWFFDKKEKLPRKPPSKGQILGDACHGRIEAFLTSGADVRGPLELMGAGMLEPYLWAAPFKGGPGEVEAPLLNPRLQTPGGILITGFEDFLVPDPQGLWPVIIDHKFKKKLKQYAPDEEELKTDTQCIMYGAHALARWPTAEGYEFRHHNHQTEGDGGRYPLPVSCKVPRAEGWARWLKLCEIIDGPMRAAALVAPVGGGRTPEGVPFNIASCGAFGGCDYAATCKHSPQNRFVAALRFTPIPVTTTPASTLTVKEKPMGLIAQSLAPIVQAPAAVITPPPAVKEPKVIQAKDCKQGAMYRTFSGKARFSGLLGGRAFFQMDDGSDTAVALTSPVEDLSEDVAAVEVFERNQAGVVAVAGSLGPEHAAEVRAGLSADKLEKKRRMGIVDITEDGNPVAPAQKAPSQAAPAAMVAETTPPAPVVAVSVAEAIAFGHKRGRTTKAESEAKKAANFGQVVPGVAVVSDKPAAPAPITIKGAALTSAPDFDIVLGAEKPHENPVLIL